jgi:hypothetical protein
MPDGLLQLLSRHPVANPKHLAKLLEGVEAWNRWRADDRRVRPDLEGADLRGANLLEAQLHSVDLSLAILEEADLTKVDATRADFSDVILTKANLSLAALTDADLSNADLRGANLSDVLLGWANLRGADLSEANLRGADLTGTNLSEALLRATAFDSAFGARTVWAAVDLSDARGLDTVRHFGPSEVGVQTLKRSRGRIPAEFLKGCGLADWEVEQAKLYDPDLTPTAFRMIQDEARRLYIKSPIKVPDLFISYSHGDAGFVDALEGKLDEKGIRYWRDTKDATAGRMDKVIELGMSSTPAVLLLLSEHSVTSDWVEFEVDKAVQLSKKLGRDVLCPVALDRAWLESDRFSGNLRTQIKKYNVLDFSQWPDEQMFSTQFRKLVDGLGIHYRGADGGSGGG